MRKEKFYAIGVMSGTSLDGLDLSYCSYTKRKKNWAFQFLKGTTINYTAQWKSKLKKAQTLNGNELLKLNAEYGRWIGEQILFFIKHNKISKLNLIASHGHTVFHQPGNKFTFQIGDGNAIHALTNVPVVFDFRSLDVQHGGQGAPFVPMGDRHLFSDYDVCLNLGGIANLSMERKSKRIAFDICFANMGLNYLMNAIGKDFDRNGELASKGKVNQELLRALNESYRSLRKSRPSLARELFENKFQKLLSTKKIGIEDKLRTVCESIATEFAKAVDGEQRLNVLMTGGGTKNKFLVSCIQSKLPKASLSIPENHIIDFKEALIFGFLGVLRLLGKKNVLKSYTKSQCNSMSGVLVGV